METLKTIATVTQILQPFLLGTVAVMFVLLMKSTYQEQARVKQAIRFLSQNGNPLAMSLLSEIMARGPLTKEQVAQHVEQQQLGARQEFVEWLERIKKSAPPEELERIELLETEMHGIFDMAQTLSPDSSDEYRVQVMQNLQHSLDQLRQRLEE